MDDDDADAASFLTQVGRQLAIARKAKGYSLQDAADFLGMNRAAVGHWETGTNPIDLRKLRKLAAFYETTVMALIADRMTDEDIVMLTRRQLKEASGGAAAQPTVIARKAKPKSGKPGRDAA